MCIRYPKDWAPYVQRLNEFRWAALAKRVMPWEHERPAKGLF